MWRYAFDLCNYNNSSICKTFFVVGTVSLFSGVNLPKVTCAQSRKFTLKVVESTNDKTEFKMIMYTVYYVFSFFQTKFPTCIFLEESL